MSSDDMMTTVRRDSRTRQQHPELAGRRNTRTALSSRRRISEQQASEPNKQILDTYLENTKYLPENPVVGGGGYFGPTAI
ncbi:hypothetical protein KCU93_g408, partial [Aureobasidium melanogenum]